MYLNSLKYFFITAFVLLYTSLSAQTVPYWIAESNKNTRILLDVMVRFNPESAARYGIDGYDENIFDIRPGYIEREQKAYNDAKSELQKRLAAEKNADVKYDLKILIDAIDEQIESTRLNQKYFLPYFNISQTIFYSLMSLLDDQVDKSRYPAALERLKKYTGISEGYTAVTVLAQNNISAKRSDENLRGPVKKELQRDLDNSSRFLAGIKNLFEKYEINGHETAFDSLSQQLAVYDEFLRNHVLPRAREDFRLPEEVYRHNLKTYGVNMPVAELMRRAKVSYKTLQNDMNSLTRLISQQNGWDVEDYRELVQHLKKDQIVGENILPLYQNRIKELEEILKKYGIVSLPERDMRIRLASEAESAAIPAPHMRPPRLINNNGEMGEFVLPLKFPGEDVKMDDFTHESMTWTLAVHEGRPGHEMQFSLLVEKGVSLARAIYAFNSVNVEGWALYTEHVMKPYLPLVGQFGTLQSLLMRSARAFLDPGLQLGLISTDEAIRILREEVMLSEGLTLQEIERYTFRAPGQATSYFCGYQRMLELRADVELKLGEKFNQRDFHDFVLRQGILPPTLLYKIVMDKFIRIN